MAIVYAPNNNNLLGSLGTVATLAGTFIPGAQGLLPVGLGMNTLNSAMKGDTQSTTQGIGQIMQNLKNNNIQLNNPINPASNNNQQSYTPEQIAELRARGWAKYGGGF